MSYIQILTNRQEGFGQSGTLVDSSSVDGQERQSVAVADPHTLAAIAGVARTPNADYVEANPGGNSGSVSTSPITLLNSPLAKTDSYAQLHAGIDGLSGRVLAVDGMGRLKVVAEGNIFEQILAELRALNLSVALLKDPGFSATVEGSAVEEPGYLVV